MDKLLGTQLGYGSYALLGIVLAAVLLVCSFFMDKEWKRITAIILAMLMFQPSMIMYGAVFDSAIPVYGAGA